MPEYKVTWKKEYKVNEPDELSAVDEAEDRLKKDMAQQFFGAGEFFDVAVQEEPIKEIHLTVEGIKEFIEKNFGEVINAEPERVVLPEWKPLTITDKQAQEFIDFLEAELREWIKKNWKCFIENRSE